MLFGSPYYEVYHFFIYACLFYIYLHRHPSHNHPDEITVYLHHQKNYQQLLVVKWTIVVDFDFVLGVIANLYYYCLYSLYYYPMIISKSVYSKLMQNMVAL